MEHVKALAIKGIMTLVILFLVLGFGYDASLGDVIIITLILGIVSYLLGDLAVLPRTSNMIATASDFGLSFLLLWALGTVLMDPTQSLVVASLLSALLIAAGEWFFHSYMEEKVHHLDSNSTRI